MKKLYILVPSRGNRSSLLQMIESWEATSGERSELIIIIDSDEKEKYTWLFTRPKIGINVVVLTKRYFLCEKLNSVSRGVVRGDFGINALGIGYVGDDCMFRTEGWEEKITHQLENKDPQKRILYGNDLLQGENLPNNVFIHSQIIEQLGFMAPPELRHYYIDNYWKDLGLKTHELMYFPEIIIEHMDHSVEKGPKDALHEEMENFIKIDHTIYDKYVLSGALALDAKKILMKNNE